MTLRYAIATDGSSDRLLINHIDWALSRLCCCDFSGEWADPRVFETQSRDVEARVSEAIANYECNLLFIHRDAEAEDRAARLGEIVTGVRRAGVGTRYVALIPIRMTEAWLLTDESAIRRAAGNPNGRAPIGMPSVREIEGIGNPKAVLEQCLVQASGKSGRRLDIFRRDIPAMRHRVAELISNFESLLELPSFSQFYKDLESALSDLGCGRSR